MVGVRVGEGVGAEVGVCVGDGVGERVLKVEVYLSTMPVCTGYVGGTIPPNV